MLPIKKKINLNEKEDKDMEEAFGLYIAYGMCFGLLMGTMFMSFFGEVGVAIGLSVGVLVSILLCLIKYVKNKRIDK